MRKRAALRGGVSSNQRRRRRRFRRAPPDKLPHAGQRWIRIRNRNGWFLQFDARAPLRREPRGHAQQKNPTCRFRYRPHLPLRYITGEDILVIVVCV